VYLFAGASRRGDIRQHLQRLAKDQFHLELRELDLEQHHSHDLSKTKLWDDLYADIDQGKVDVLLWSPPCTTFSRARHHFKHDGKFLYIPMCRSGKKNAFAKQILLV